MCVCVLEYVHHVAAGCPVKMAAFVVLSPFSIFAFSHERRKEEEELNIDISPQLGSAHREKSSKEVNGKSEKKKRENSMTVPWQIAGDPRVFFCLFPI